MLGFLRGEADCLVATTIIESGLDIPQANTLIVERADHLGLAQSYQIRGRVGRSSERAFAYMLYPSEEALTPRRWRRGWRPSPTTPSSARAFASRCATSSCAGPATCSGDEQSGPRRRGRASSSTSRCSTRRSRSCARAGPTASADEPEDAQVRLDVAVDAYVPADYVPFEAAKIDVHRRIAGRPRAGRAAGPPRRAARSLRAGAGAGGSAPGARARADRARRAWAPARPRFAGSGSPRRRSSSTPQRWRGFARRCPRRSTSRARRRCRCACRRDPDERLAAIVELCEALRAAPAGARGRVPVVRELRVPPASRNRRSRM